jgi:hypothetical protein
VTIRPITPEDIEHSKNDQEIVRLTTLQIIKDFEQFGIPIEFPDDINFGYQDLSVQLENHIAYLVDNNMQRLYALLYRIDISDSMIRKKQRIRFDLTMADIITELVLERELKKVMFREYFKRFQ